MVLPACNWCVCRRISLYSLLPTDFRQRTYVWSKRTSECESDLLFPLGLPPHGVSDSCSQQEMSDHHEPRDATHLHLSSHGRVISNLSHPAEAAHHVFTFPLPNAHVSMQGEPSPRLALPRTATLCLITLANAAMLRVTYTHALGHEPTHDQGNADCARSSSCVFRWSSVRTTHRSNPRPSGGTVSCVHTTAPPDL